MITVTVFWLIFPWAAGALLAGMLIGIALAATS
jgi:hypothetical protein